jgi:uncharacterized protein with HEPN domain
MRDTRDRFLDMLEAISRIEKYAPRGRRAFEEDELVQTFVIHNLQVLGEAAFKLPENVRDQWPQVPWAKILGMRHILVHDYFKLDTDIVWAAIEKDLPDLKATLKAIVGEMGWA